jgi:hypothetical protein
MKVPLKQLVEPGVARLPAPCLGVADEEALVAGEAVHDRQLLAVEEEAVGVAGHGEAGDVGDALPRGQLAVDVLTREWLVAADLLGQAARDILELLRVLGLPPVAQQTLAVVQPSLVVEQM